MLVVLTPCCSFPYYIDWMQSMSKINRTERSFTFGGLTENVISPDPRSRAWVEVDSKIIENNARVLKKFIGDDPVCLVLGDNIFYGHGFEGLVKQARENVESTGDATVFGYYVNDPERYGVVEFDYDDNAISLEEKPSNPKSNYAVSGLYFYPNDAVGIAKNQKPSDRNELEITDTNKVYLSQKRLKVEKLGRGCAWLDTGTHDSLLEASHFVQILEKRQGVKITCIEEIALLNGWIGKKEILGQIGFYGNCEYSSYLKKLIK